MSSANDLLVPIVIGLGVLVLIAVVGAVLGPRPRFVKKRFLTEHEAWVLGLLEAALPGHRVMAQVAMGALIKAGETNRKAAQSTRNRFAQKIVDFVVVTRDTAEVVGLVELDDRTHSASTDARRDRMTAAAGYRTVRIPSRPRATPESVGAAVAELLRPETARRK